MNHMTTEAAPADQIEKSVAAARRATWFGWWFYAIVAVVAPFALILAAVACLYLWWKLAEAKAAHEVGLEVARIQANGEPVTIYDLYQYHQVPAGANDTTALWVTALKQVNGVQVNPTFLAVPIVGGSRDPVTALDPSLPDNELSLTEKYLALCQPGLQAADNATKANGECRFPAPYEMGINMPGGVVQQCRGLARVLSLQTRVRLARGDTDGAIESAATMLGLVQAMENEFTLVNQLVHIAVTGIALGDIRFLVATGELTDEQLARLQREVHAIEIQNSFTTSLLGERGMGFHSFHQFAGAPPVPTKADPMSGGKLTRSKACQIYLEVLQRIIDASRKPMPQALDDSRLLSQQVAMEMQSANPLDRVNFALTQQMLPSVAAAFDARARIEADRNLTLAAIATRRYHLAHGALPQKLEDLGEFLPAIPIDSYDGLPLRMKQDEDELIFYSIGRNRVDDGGSDKNGHFEPDMVVRIPALAE
jgi:hypothetical protein